jgi:DNA polymerase-3 subunit delta'
MIVMYSVAMVNKELKRIISLTPFEARYKIAILLDAEHLNLSRQEGGNAFLKVLEEPTPQTVFILVSERPDLLLPTIRSRCQPVRFHPLSPDAIEQALVDRFEAPAERAATVARMADGSFRAARHLLSDDVSMDLRNEVLEYLRKCWADESGWLTDFAERLSQYGREYTTTFLRFLLGWLRDIVLIRELGTTEARIVNVDQQEAIENFAVGLKSANLDAMVESVEEAIRLVPRMVQPRLIALSLAEDMARAMRGRRGTGLLLLAEQLVRDEAVNLSD